MNVEVTKRGVATVIALSGEVDLDSSPRAREALLEAVARRAQVVVDLSAVDYIDSSGVASLVEAYQQARKNSSTFTLATPSEPARRVLELARLDRVFTIHDSMDAALSDAN